MTEYQAHNNERIVEATDRAHWLMCGYAQMSSEEQADAIRDIMRLIASLSQVLKDPMVHN